MPAPAALQGHLTFSLSPAVLDGGGRTTFGGLTATEAYQLLVPDGDTYLTRVLLPVNAEFNNAGTGGANDAFEFETFPALTNADTTDPVLDQQGLPMNFARLRAIVIQVQPIYPYEGYAASTVLTTDNVANATDGNQIVIDSVTKTFKATLTPSADEVKIGANADATLLNLARSLNFTGTAGTDYVGTVPHPTVSASSAVTAHAITLTARRAGAAGNAIVTTTDEPTYSFTDAATTLTGGSDDYLPARTPRPLGGTVQVLLTGDLLGASGTLDHTFSKPGTIVILGDWTPGTAGAFKVIFTSTEPAPLDIEDINAACTILLLGNST